MKTEAPKWIKNLGQDYLKAWDRAVEILGNRFNYGAATKIFKNVAKKMGLKLPSHISSLQQMHQACIGEGLMTASDTEVYAGMPKYAIAANFKSQNDRRQAEEYWNETDLDDRYSMLEEGGITGIRALVRNKWRDLPQNVQRVLVDEVMEF